jgi:putative Mg2+ transporter-C (MgtC) family protein
METILNDQFITIALQLTLAMMLGLLLGFERILVHKTAGMRTYALVSMTSAMFITISEIVTRSYFLEFGSLMTDPLRVAAQVVVGIGFLGAGLIIFKDDKVQNLTTASGLWTCAAIGMAVGFGLYAEAIFATFLTFFVLAILSVIERVVRLRMFPDPDFEKNLKKQK